MYEIYDINDTTYHPDIQKRFNPDVPHFLMIEAIKLESNPKESRLG